MTAAWQGRGQHQHPPRRPRSPGSRAIRSGLVSRRCSYRAVDSRRCSRVASLGRRLVGERGRFQVLAPASLTAADVDNVRVVRVVEVVLHVHDRGLHAAACPVSAVSHVLHRRRRHRSPHDRSRHRRPAREGPRRQGPHPRGQARRLFTQTTTDENGHPVRDPRSCTYLATFEPADRFAQLTAAEARRRGSDHIRQPVVLGDGAAWTSEPTAPS